MGEHSGRVAVVTGGAKGIGGAIVDRLAAQGATIAIFDVDEQAARAKISTLELTGALARAWTVDVSVRAQVEAAVAEVEPEPGPVVILVNNAGMIVFGSPVECRDAGWGVMPSGEH